MRKLQRQGSFYFTPLFCFFLHCTSFTLLRLTSHFCNLQHNQHETFHPNPATEASRNRQASTMKITAILTALVGTVGMVTAASLTDYKPVSRVDMVSQTLTPHFFRVSLTIPSTTKEPSTPSCKALQAASSSTMPSATLCSSAQRLRVDVRSSAPAFVVRYSRVSRHFFP